MKRLCWILVFAAVAPICARAEWSVSQWNPACTGSYRTYPASKRIAILSGSGAPFKFEAYDDATGALCDINVIDIEGSPVSNVKIMVHGNPALGHYYGANEVKMIDLWGAWNTAVVGVTTFSHLGATGGVWADKVGGSILVEGNLLQDFHVDNVVDPSHPPSFHVYGNCASITIADAAGATVQVDGLLLGTIGGGGFGDIALNGSGTHTGNIHSHDPYSATLQINGNMAGYVELGNLVNANISITGDIIDSGPNYFYVGTMTNSHISCRDMRLRYNDGGANIGYMFLGWVNGGPTSSLMYTQHFTGSLAVNGTLSGRIVMRGWAELPIYVNTIDAPVDIWPDGSNHGRGGIDSIVGFTPACSITVDQFTAGRLGFWWIMQDPWYPPGYKPYFGGTVNVNSAMGPDTEISTVQPGTEPNIRVDLTADIHINGNENEAGNLAGVIHSTGHLGAPSTAPSISIAGACNGSIETVGAPGSSAGSINGDISIGDLNGHIHSVEDLNARILVNGGFRYRGGDEAEVLIDGQFGTGALFVVNDDGPNYVDDVWEAGARVKIGAADPYTGPDQSAGLYESSCIKGDANSDGRLDAFDIDPFVLAIQSPPVAYLAAFPGLATSRVYRADLNCDGAADAFDIDPFVLRLSGGAWSCSSTEDPEVCPSSSLMAGGDTGEDAALDPALDPVAVALMFQTYVAPEHLPLAVDAIAQMAAAPDETPHADFWADVLSLLE